MADRSAESQSSAWWLPAAAGKRHEIVKAVCDRIVEAQGYRQEEFARNERFYGLASSARISSSKYSRRVTNVGRSGDSGRVSFNVIKSCSDAYTAKLTKDRIKTSFVTDDGNTSLQEKAKSAERFVDGQKYELGYYRRMPQLALDTCIYKNGIYKTFIAGRKGKLRICGERILPIEILVDDAEGVYADPPSMYQERQLDRAVVRAKWGKNPKLLTAIDAATPCLMATDQLYSVADQIRVREAWHKPTPDGDGLDGYWCVCIDDATLTEGRWTRPDFPFSILRRADPLQGWWGSALADDLAGIQREITTILYNISRHYRLLGASKVIVPVGFNKNKFDNDIDILEANLQSGAPYIMCPQNLVSPEMYAHLDRLYAKAYELSGVAQMAAQSQIPQQVESGKAIEALADVESDRFMTSFRQAEHFDIDVTRKIITLAREISQKQPDFGVKAFDSRSSKKIVFAKNWLEEEEYTLKEWPTNLLADDPVAKMGQVERFASAGWIQPDEAMEMLGYPDTSAALSDKLANKNATRRIIAKIMDEGEYIGPDPVMVLSESIPIVRSAYLETIGKDGVDMERAGLLQTWLTQAEQLVNPPPQPTQVVPNMQAAQATQALAASQQNGVPAPSPSPNPAPPTMQ